MVEPARATLCCDGGRCLQPTQHSLVSARGEDVFLGGTETVKAATGTKSVMSAFTSRATSSIPKVLKR
jgi:hypothetical protein